MGSPSLWRNRLASLLALMKANKSSSSAAIHSETGFHHLIDREFKRSERSGQLSRILLVYRINAHGVIVPLSHELDDRTISILSRNYRGTDYIGWYRQGRILGVLLTAQRSDSAREGCDSVRIRLVDSLHDALTVMGDRSLQIRVLEQDEINAFNAADHLAPNSGAKVL
jgi:hypothetical protein